MTEISSPAQNGSPVNTAGSAGPAPENFDIDPMRIVALLAAELGVRTAQVAATVELLDGGATVPFIARYRKEVTGGLDDTVLRNLEVRLIYMRELESRQIGRASVRERVGQEG